MTASNLRMKNNKNMTANLTTPRSFWVIVSLFLIWNLLGVFHYLTSVNATVENLVAQGMTIAQAEVFYHTPNYHYALFALGVWSGLCGSVCLILRKARAIPIFLLSVVTTIISFILDVLAGNLAILGSTYVGIMIFTLILAFFQLFYSKHMKVRNILR